jgi:hypothetical protein
MAKRKEKIDLSKKNLIFILQNVEYKLLHFCPNKMIVELQPLTQREDAIKEIPFAHLSKELKKIIKPN